ncbi:SR-related and CTD-associated factor 4 isoform 2-T2 [Discoglossus pictus]
MDAVNAFNQELFSLMDMKPPISRAKMILITKAAIKAIKLYKHVVQIVEKFVKKCKPEYKVPGLYVIDSIVRQSRHQFGIDKDVFGPRFTKNLTATFQCLYLCPTEDKSKIVRVLNLWQKNGVFKIEIIQPLLDMAAGAGLFLDNSANDEESSPPQVMLPTDPLEDAHDSAPTMSVPQLPSSDAFAAVAQLFQSTQGQQLQQILQTFQQPPKPQSPINENVLAQVEAIASQLQSASAHQSERKTAFDKLLDRFDYDDEPEAVDEHKKDAASPPQSPKQPPFTFPTDSLQPAAYPQLSGQMPNMEEFQPMMMGLQQESLHHQPSLPPNGQMLGFGMIPAQPYTTMAPTMVPQASPQPYQHPFQMQQNEMHIQKDPQQEMQIDIDPPNVQEGKRPMPETQNSKPRSPKRRRSRSGSRSQRSRHRRSRSRSRDRRRSSPKSRSQERRDREKDRERRQKGLPPIKAEAVSVCSTTLWVGQLDKRTTQPDVASLLEEFGPIESINMIPPRGCAYIVMGHRQDAYRALQKLSRGSYKVNQKAIKIAWALNKGIKSDYKQYWDVEKGVTYVPWNKVKPEELESFCEGGLLDNETLCPEWKAFAKKPEGNGVSQNEAAESAQIDKIAPMSQGLPMMSVPIRAPMPGMSVPAHQPMAAHQPVPSVPSHQAMVQPHQAVNQVPPHQGLPPPQGPPPQGLPMPQGVPHPQGMPLPQGIPHPQGIMPPQGIPPIQGMLPPQGMPPHQPVPGVGALQPPAFAGLINIPPPGFAPGVPPPPFMRAGFNPMQLPPGFLPPPGLPPPMTPVSMPPPTTGINIPTSTAGSTPSDSSKEQAHGNTNVMGSARENVNMDTDDDEERGFGSAPQGGQNNPPGPMNPHHGVQQGGPPHGQQHGPPSGPPHGQQHGPPSGPPHGQQHGPPSGPPHGPQHGPQHGPPHGHPHGPHHGPPGGPPHGPPTGPPHGSGMGLQAPSTGLLGARPGLIPLQRPPGAPPHMQRFPHRPPHMMHRGPSPGPGGMPPHGMRGPYPPHGHFRARGPGDHGGPEEREGRPYRNDRQGFNPGRDQERFGRRPYGNRNEDEREHFGNRPDERDYDRPPSRGRRSWGRGSPEHDRHRDSEERNRWSAGRERGPHRGMGEEQENKKPDMTEVEFSEKNHESFSSRMGNAEPVSELAKEKPQSSGQKPTEEIAPKDASSAELSEKDSGPTTEDPR